jgi:hypothetical protein
MYAQIPCNYDHYDYNTYDVKNVHCLLQEGMREPQPEGTTLVQ